MTTVKLWIKHSLTIPVTDIFGISPNLLNIGADHLNIKLTDIFNSSINKGVFPDEFKTTFIYLIHKRESKIVCTN